MHTRLVRYLIALSYSKLVSFPARAPLPARNSLVKKVNFLGLFPKSGKDQ